MEPELARTSEINELDGDSIRDLVDARESYELLRQAEHDLRHSYGGSLKFEARGDTEYLIPRPFRSDRRRSRGPRSAETEAVLENFRKGKERTDDRVRTLRARLEKFAPVLRARSLGRVPSIAARILDDDG